MEGELIANFVIRVGANETSIPDVRNHCDQFVQLQQSILNRLENASKAD